MHGLPWNVSLGFKRRLNIHWSHTFCNHQVKISHNYIYYINIQIYLKLKIYDIVWCVIFRNSENSVIGKGSAQHKINDEDIICPIGLSCVIPVVINNTIHYHPSSHVYRPHDLLDNMEIHQSQPQQLFRYHNTGK